MKQKRTKVLSIVLMVLMIVLTSLFALKNIFYFDILVVGDSMKKTLYEGEMGFALREVFISDIKRGDIIIFERDNNVVVKRVIGVPNDHIVINEEGIFVNDNKLEEDYVTSKNKEGTFINSGAYNDLVLQDEQYFVLGDNRLESLDSRYYGAIERECISGKLKLIYARGDCTDSSCNKLKNSGFVPFKWF